MSDQIKNPGAIPPFRNGKPNLPSANIGVRVTKSPSKGNAVNHTAGRVLDHIAAGNPFGGPRRL